MITVEFDSLEDFIAELRDGQTVVRDNLVRWKVGQTAEQAEAVTFEIDVWATAIVKLPEGEQLFEFGRSVGSDDASGAHGTKAANAMRAALAEACDDLGLRLRPGKIEPY